MVANWFILLVCLYSIGVSLAAPGIGKGQICTWQEEHCEGDQCYRKQECDHGTCDAKALCECDFCYSGKSCSEYVDNHKPRFQEKSLILVAEYNQRKPLGYATAVDDDLKDTCIGSDLEACPCARVNYYLKSRSFTDKFFTVDHATGMIMITPGMTLKSAKSYMLTVVASSNNETSVNKDQHPLESTDVIVHVKDVKDKNGKFRTGLSQSPEERNLRSKFLEKLSNNIPRDDAYHNYVGNKLQKYLTKKDRFQSKVDAYESFRNKRDTTRPSPSELNMVLDQLTGSTEILQMGHNICFHLDLQLPVITVATSLNVEIFVMDVISGTTTLALNSISADAITSGQTISWTEGLKLKVFPNLEIPTIDDSALIIFNGLLNSESGSETDPHLNNTIRIKFCARHFENSDFPSNQTYISAGAMYSDEKYIWVTQVSYKLPEHMKTFV